VKAGWAFITIGVGSSAVYQHLDVYVWGGLYVLIGIVLLFVKGV